MPAPIESFSDSQLRTYHKYHYANREPPLWLLVILGILGAACGSLALGAALDELFPQMRAHTWTGIGILAGAALLLGITAFYVREYVKTRFYPVAEIAAGIAIATQAARPDNLSPIVTLIAFVGAVRIIIDGFARYKKLVDDAEKAKAESGTPPPAGG